MLQMEAILSRTLAFRGEESKEDRPRELEDQGSSPQPTQVGKMFEG